jgi:rhamnogalacturonan endolyase
MSFNNDWNPVVSYFNASNSNRASISVYNKLSGTWTFTGTISSRDISNNTLLRDDQGNLYASFTDIVTNGSGRSLARVMKLAAGTTNWTELKNPDVVQGIDEPAGNLSLAIGADNRPYIIYTKINSSSVVTPIVQVLANVAPPPPPPPPPADEVVTTPKQVEKLNRGLVAVRINSSEVYIGWRLFGTDPSGIGFNVYRDGVKLNASPIVNSTNFVDQTNVDGSYTVRPVLNGTEQSASRAVSAWSQNYLNIALQKPVGGTTPVGEAYTYSPNDCSVGDLDGDGEYEIILKWDPSNAKDNSQSGYTGNVYIDAYKLDGTRLWRIDLGRNIRAGAHYTQFMVYDFDGDGRAEVACKTADGTIDGTGLTIGDPVVDYRNSGGYILSGPEFLTIFNGLTGAAMATTDYLPARGAVTSWGDNYGNRVDRFIAAVAYVDGARPSLIMGRGYYTRLVRVAWDWRNGQLTHRWTFDSNIPGNNFYAGMGNHQMSVADADGDGKDEIFNGSSTINDNGNGLWTNGMGHGDALHVTDIDPDRPGQELWQPYEFPPGNGRVGAALVDAKTGARIFTVPENTADVGRGLTANIDPRYKGNEVWASRGGLYTATGVQIGTVKPSMNFASWWDADLTRELLDGNTISKWDYNSNTSVPLLVATGASSNNGTKANPGLSADILGDWREEVIFRTDDNSNLRIYTTTDVTNHRLYTLMHDPQYRVAIAWQNSAYNQPPHPSFYIGDDMDPAPLPNIEYVQDIIPPVALAKDITVTLSGGTVNVLPQDVDNGSYDAFDIRSLELSISVFDCSDIGANSVTLTVTDNNGNVSTANATVTVVGSIPTAPLIAVTRTDNTLTGANEKTIFIGYGAQEVILTATNPETGITYKWSPSTYLSDDAIANPVFTPTTPGIYTVEATAANEYGCTSTASVTITVIDVRCGNEMNKVMICHKSKINCISSGSVQDHLAHGDNLGSCGGENATSSRSAGNNMAIEQSKTRLSAYPNPLNAQSKVVFQLAKAGKYSLAVYDMKGALINVIGNGQAQSNKQISYNLDASKYSKGLYFIKLMTETEILMERIIVK